ncbi:MAG: GNAT family N-acetyltransferase [Bellilinea sp.]
MVTRQAIPPVCSNRICLRLLEEKDLPLTLDWRNQDSIRKWFFHSDLVTKSQHLAWYQQYLQRDDDYIFIIEMLEQNRRIPVGQIALYHIDWQNRSAEYGRLMIGEPAAQGQGFAREATKIVLEIGFQTLGLGLIYLEVFENNFAARAVYTTCGFEVQANHNGIVRMQISSNKTWKKDPV